MRYLEYYINLFIILTYFIGPIEYEDCLNYQFLHLYSCEIIITQIKSIGA